LDINHASHRTKSDLGVIDVTTDQDSFNIRLDNEIFS
jgi:hypothetical protein